MDRAGPDAEVGAQAEQAAERIDFGLVAVEVPACPIGGVRVAQREAGRAQGAGAVRRKSRFVQQAARPLVRQNQMLRTGGREVVGHARHVVRPVGAEGVRKEGQRRFHCGRQERQTVSKPAARQ